MTITCCNPNRYDRGECLGPQCLIRHLETLLADEQDKNLRLTGLLDHPLLRELFGDIEDRAAMAAKAAALQHWSLVDQWSDVRREVLAACAWPKLLRQEIESPAPTATAVGERGR